jgi:uncharacterized protein (TIGR02466 family)
MSLKVAYFQPIILAIDEIPPVEYSKMFNLTEQFHLHTELNDVGDPSISARGGQQIQVYPNTLQHDVSWLVTYLETLCTGYMELVTAQSGAEELKHCRPVVTSIWTIRQTAGDYQEMHSHPNGNISGNIYITVPDLNEGSKPSDCQILFRMPQSKDITKFVMNDTWKYTPQAGTVILFPSHLPHTVYPWDGAGHRTAIAFDAILRPKE